MADSDFIGSYEIRGVLGRGGMGEVFKCWDNKHNRYVAVKVMLSNYSVHTASNGTDDLNHRFQREMKFTAQLNHPHIVQFVDSGYDSNARCFWIATALMEGCTVKEEIERQKRIAWQQAVEIALGAAKGLSYIHERKILHRDIKPSNVFLHHGVPVLFDFGIARSSEGSVLTEEGKVSGTYAYMAPEVLNSKEATPKSDVYGLGLVLYEMLTGRYPYSADNLEPVS